MDTKSLNFLDIRGINQDFCFNLASFSGSSVFSSHLSFQSLVGSVKTSGSAKPVTGDKTASTNDDTEIIEDI